MYYGNKGCNSTIIGINFYFVKLNFKEREREREFLWNDTKYKVFSITWFSDNFFL